MLNHKNVKFHKNLSKFLKNFIGFFKEPKELINNLIEECENSEDEIDIRIKCYFIAGLIKGLGV